MDRAIRLSAEDEKAPWSGELVEAAARARAEAEAKLGLELDEPPLVEVHLTEKEFYAALGQRPHEVVAVAIAAENRIVINLQRFIEGGQTERNATLVHEFTHLILGRRLPQSLPRWLDEGIAMTTAGEASLASHTRLALAATFGGLIPLEELSGGGFDARDQELAYAQSQSAAQFLMKGRDPKPLVRKLGDRVEGKELRAHLLDPDYIRRLDREWRGSLRTLWTWVAALSGGGVLWGVITVLFLIAYWRKRRMAKLKNEQWEEEAREFPWME